LIATDYAEKAHLETDAPFSWQVKHSFLFKVLEMADFCEFLP
jgi:hypothetical protein